MSREFKQHDKVNGPRWGNPGAYADAEVGFAYGEYVYVVWPDGMMREFSRADGRLTRLPAPAAPFKVGDEVEVARGDGQWDKKVVTDVTPNDRGGWRVSFSPVGRYGGSYISHVPSNLIRPYTPPQARRVPLGAADFPPGTVVRDNGWMKGLWSMVNGTSLGGIEVSRPMMVDESLAIQHTTFEMLIEGWLYATPTDRNPDGSIAWKPCYREEVVNA